jgi:hypothetical protein
MGSKDAGSQLERLPVVVAPVEVWVTTEVLTTGGSSHRPMHRR